MIGVSNEYDELIFDYLEGNLSGNEKHAFETLLSADEALKAEVRAWKRTYMAESFPATTQLETQILGAAKKTRWFFSLNVFTAVLILLFVPAQVKDITTTMQSQKSHLADTVSTQAHQDVSPVCLEEQLPNQGKTVKRHIPAPPKEAAADELFKTEEWIIENKTIVLPFPDTSPLNLAQQSTRIFKPVPVQLPSTSRVKRFSWKETRAINRRKRRDYQKKLESKFLEGNVPYVVPLNVTNF